MNPMPPLSIVIPCLNEEESLLKVLEKIARLRQTFFENSSVEVIVSDNGSLDRSVEVAQRHGAKVVHCHEKGYGATLNFGIQAATHEIVVFADADDTYDFMETPRLIAELEKGF